jgi:hypothetical protein
MNGFTTPSSFRKLSKGPLGPREQLKDHTGRPRVFNGLVWFFDPGFFTSDREGHCPKYPFNWSREGAGEPANTVDTRRSSRHKRWHMSRWGRRAGF